MRIRQMMGACLVIAGLALAGCSGHGDSPIRPATTSSSPTSKAPSPKVTAELPAPSPTGTVESQDPDTPPAGDNADQAAKRLAEDFYRLDSRTDKSPYDGFMRKKATFTPHFAKALDPGDWSVQDVPTMDWGAVSGHHATTQARAKVLTEEEHPPDTKHRADRQVDVTVTATGDGGWSKEYTFIAYLNLAKKSGGAWRIDGLKTVGTQDGGTDDAY